MNHAWSHALEVLGLVALLFLLLSTLKERQRNEDDEERWDWRLHLRVRPIAWRHHLRRHTRPDD